MIGVHQASTRMTLTSINGHQYVANDLGVYFGSTEEARGAYMLDYDTECGDAGLDRSRPHSHEKQTSPFSTISTLWQIAQPDARRTDEEISQAVTAAPSTPTPYAAPAVHRPLPVIAVACMLPVECICV